MLEKIFYGESSAYFPPSAKNALTSAKSGVKICEDIAASYNDDGSQVCVGLENHHACRPNPTPPKSVRQTVERKEDSAHVNHVGLRRFLKIESSS